MSLGNFLKHIWQGIKHIFDGLLPVLKQAVHWGVVITDAIKTFDANHPDVADILTAIIPGNADDNVKTKLREALPKIVVEMRLVDATLGLTDPNEIMKAALKVIEQLDGDYKSAVLHNLSILTAQVVSDGKLDWKDAVYLLQWYYEHKKVSTVPAAAVPQ